MKKVSEMSEKELTSCCHWYCEENNLTNEFNKFQEEILSDYCFCYYLNECIEDGMCCDLQLIHGKYIKVSALPEINIDREKLTICCSNCKHKNIH